MLCYYPLFRAETDTQRDGRVFQDHQEVNIQIQLSLRITVYLEVILYYYQTFSLSFRALTPF